MRVTEKRSVRGLVTDGRLICFIRRQISHCIDATFNGSATAGMKNECRLDGKVGVERKNNDEAMSETKRENKKRVKESKDRSTAERGDWDGGRRKQAPKCGSGYSYFWPYSLCPYTSYTLFLFIDSICIHCSSIPKHSYIHRFVVVIHVQPGLPHHRPQLRTSSSLQYIQALNTASMPTFYSVH